MNIVYFFMYIYLIKDYQYVQAFTDEEKKAGKAEKGRFAALF